MWHLSNKLCENLRSLQERAGASSGESSLAGAPSALSKSSLTVVKFSCGGRTKATLNLSPSGMTCERLTDALGMDSWMSSVAGSRAKTSQSPGKARESEASEVDSGKSLRASLAKYDPVSRSWKIARHLFGEDLAQSSETWPRWGMTQDGELYPLLTAALPTYEKECGLWPTPRKQEPGATTEGYGRGLAELVEGKSQKPAKRPTPRKQAAQECTDRPDKPNGHNGNLEEVVYARMYPTPTKHNAKEGNYPAEATLNTPTLTAHVCAGPTTQPKYLNPVWVEWLMGWPTGWTDLQPLATAKCQSWQRQHGAS